MPTTIEFTSRPGRSFTAKVKDPMNAYADLQIGIVVTEVTSRRYRFVTTEVNKLVWVEVTDGPVNGVGFADLANLNKVGVAEVLDDAYLASIHGKANLIGTGNATVSAPVAPSGLILTPIVIGDDYMAANGRAFIWTVAKPTSFAGTLKCFFGGELNASNKFKVEGTVVDNLNGTLNLVFDLLKEATQNLQCGSYKYSAEVCDSNGVEVTRVHSLEKSVHLVKKFTN